MRNLSLLFFESTILVILISLYTTFLPLYFSDSYITYILLIVISSLILYSLRKKNQAIKGNSVNISFLFLISFLIVHFQIYLDYTLSLRDNLDILKYYLDYTIVPKAITLAAIALVCYLIGNTLYKPNIKQKHIPEPQVTKSFSLLFLNIIIILFFLIFIYVTPTSYFLGGYGELLNSGGIGYAQYKSNHFLQVAIWSYIICNLVMLSSNKGRSSGFWSYITSYSPIFTMIVLIYSALVLYAGDRGPFIKIAILIYISYIISQEKKVNLLKVLLIIFVFGSFIQFWGYFRNTGSNLDFISRLNEAYFIQQDISTRGDGSVFPSTVELAMSLGSYHAAVMDQESNGILYGMGALGYIVSIIPGLGNILQQITSINLSSTAAYITEYLGTTYGAGTTVLADIYLNFGFYGVLIAFTLFGYFFASLDSKAYREFSRNSLLNQILFMIFISNAIYLGRTSFFSVLSDVVLVYIFISFAFFIHKLRN